MEKAGIVACVGREMAGEGDGPAASRRGLGRTVAVCGGEELEWKDEGCFMT